MRYFVIAPDGSKYGPADLATLREWVGQGRIAPDTMLEEESSRQRVPARLVAGLGFGGEAPAVIMPAGRRPESPRPGDDGNWDIMWSYICSALTLICCLPFIFGAFAYANRARFKGNPRYKAAKICAWIVIAIYVAATPFEIAAFNQIKDFVMNQVSQPQ